MCNTGRETTDAVASIIGGRDATGKLRAERWYKTERHQCQAPRARALCQAPRARAFEEHEEATHEVGVDRIRGRGLVSRKSLAATKKEFCAKPPDK